MREHHVADNCAVIAACPNQAHAVLCLRVNEDNRVLIAPRVAHLKDQSSPSAAGEQG